MAAGIGMDTEGISFTEYGRQFTPICMRTKLIEEVVAGAERLHPLTLFRAPSGMGKTSLLGLIKEHLEKRDPKPTVFRYSFLDFKLQGYTTLAEAWGPNWIDVHFAQVDSTKERQTRFLLFDELQVLYGKEAGESLWRAFKDHLSVENPVRVFAVAAKGELAVELNQLKAELIPSVVYGGDALLFNEAEVEELVVDFNRKAGFSLPDNAATILFNWTGGHSLHLRQLLVFLSDSWKRMNQLLETKQLLWLLFSLSGVCTIAGCRAAPNFIGIHDNTKIFLHRLLLTGLSIFPFQHADDKDKEAIRDAINRGILRFTAHGEKEWDFSVTFVSPLVLSLTIHFVWGTNRRQASEEPKDLQSFVKNALRLMRSTFLKKSLGHDASMPPLERTWQMELFRAASTILPTSCNISLEVGRLYGSRGLVDFYVNDNKKWLVELAREGSRLGHHERRLEENGIYSSIPMNNFVLLDFRATKPSKALVNKYPEVWFVVYDQDFNGAEVIQGLNTFSVEFFKEAPHVEPAVNHF